LKLEVSYSDRYGGSVMPSTQDLLEVQKVFRTPVVKTTISSKGQIAIPKAVRERLNLKPGTEISIDVQGEAMVLKRLVRKHPDRHTMRGMFRDGADLLQDLTTDRAAELVRDNARLQGR
jgi:AbrB family looped-hinge helix DNA binding protein